MDVIDAINEASAQVELAGAQVSQLYKFCPERSRKYATQNSAIRWNSESVVFFSDTIYMV